MFVVCSLVLSDLGLRHVFVVCSLVLSDWDLGMHL